MKYLSFFIILLSIYGFSVNQEAAKSNQDILGEWELEFVDVGETILFPKANFKLKISEGQVSYNTDANSCHSKAKITSNTINYGNVRSTKVCCDGWRDTIGGFLNYNGHYQITNDTLIISNENIYLLVKQ